MNPITLAFIGDCVYEFAIRDYVIRKFPTLKIHKCIEKLSFAKASSQANVVKNCMKWIFPNREEWSWVKKGETNSMIPKVISPVGIPVCDKDLRLY